MPYRVIIRRSNQMHGSIAMVLKDLEDVQKYLKETKHLFKRFSKNTHQWGIQIDLVPPEGDMVML